MDAYELNDRLETALRPDAQGGLDCRGKHAETGRQSPGSLRPDALRPAFFRFRGRMPARSLFSPGKIWYDRGEHVPARICFSVAGLIPADNAREAKQWIFWKC